MRSSGFITLQGKALARRKAQVYATARLYGIVQEIFPYKPTIYILKDGTCSDVPF